MKRRGMETIRAEIAKKQDEEKKEIATYKSMIKIAYKLRLPFKIILCIC